MIGLSGRPAAVFSGGRPRQRKDFMQGLIIIGILVFAGYSLYRIGKRTGSRKGYHVGRSHGRRRW